MKTFKESIIDIPRKTYAPGVFDEADTENPKIKSSVKKLIDDQIKEFESEYPVLKISLIGSILTKRYRNDADLDINVLFDVPEDKKDTERERLSKKYLSASNPDNIQGKEIPGTKHPINYYFITDEETYDSQNQKADAVFDIENNKFVKRPEDFEFDIDMYINDFNKKVQELDVVKGELKRDIIDYEELKDLKPNDVLNLQEKIKDKLEEIEDSLEQIVKIGDGVDADRRAAFDKDMSPDEIRQFGVKNRLPKNVIYKMLEKYHYLKFYKYCKKILEDGIVSDDEIQDLGIHESIASAWADLIRRTIKRPKMKQGLQLYLKYLRQGMKDAKNKAAQHAGIDYREFGLAVKDAGLPEQITEAKGRSVAFAFGRFNPPTIGHEKLIRKVASVGANDYRIFLSRSEDSQKNPLSPQQKLQIMRKMFPQHARKIEINKTNMVLDLATDLYNKGFREIKMVAGSDRISEFKGILNKYNNQRNRHGFYNFDKIEVISAGERDPDAEGAAGMSASKMRAAAAKNDLSSFRRGLPRGVNADDIMKQVRKGMRLAASVNHTLGYENKPVASMEEFEQKQLRDLYIREVIFNIGDKVEYVKENIEGTVIRRSTNYIVIEDTDDNLHKAWIWDCIPKVKDREIQIREHNLNIDYGFEAVSEKKVEAKKSKMFNEFKKDLVNMVKNEAYETGENYANHTKEITPGETPTKKPIPVGSQADEKISKEDVDNWASSKETIDKYRERYGDEYQSKIDEVKKKMLSFKDYAKI
jgi:predicted nucleotidyltransferase